MTTFLLLTFALLLDAYAGEPRWLWSRIPHPAVIMGSAIESLDNALNKSSGARPEGTIAILLLVTGAGIIGWIISLLGPLVSILGVAVLLAQKSLIDHVRAVSNGLRQSEMSGSQALARIVGRDVNQLTPPETARAAIESLAENFSDGVIAPAFWFLIAGFPGILVYKTVNTADSMIGYRTTRYATFGWATARLDDFLNWIPARYCGVTHRFSWTVYKKMELYSHGRSTSQISKCRLARGYCGLILFRSHWLDPRSYNGKIQDLAWLNGKARHDLDSVDIDAAIFLIWRAWGLGLVITILGRRTFMDILKQFVLIATLGLLPLKTEAQCGGPFKAFKEGLKSEAVSLGISAKTADMFLSSVPARQKLCLGQTKHKEYSKNPSLIFHDV